MGRGLWFVAGAGTGMYAMVRARRIAEAFTPEGLTDRLGALALGARLLTEDVREASAVRETALRQELGLQLDGASEPRALPGLGDRERAPETSRRTPDLALAAAVTAAGSAPGVDARAC